MTPLLQDATELELHPPALRAHVKWQNANASKRQSSRTDMK
jgi:hypothetical protein